MKRLLATVAAAGILTVASHSAAVAGTPQRESMKCGEFLALDTVQRPKVIYWAEGVNNKGTPQDAVIDIEATDRVIPIIEEKCRVEPQASLWAKIEASWRQFEASVKGHLLIEPHNLPKQTLSHG